MHATVLLVEDDKNLGYILSEYLAMKGFEVTWAKDGMEAIALMTKNLYGLCILDVMLPLLDGFSVAEKMTQGESVVPFIFLTAKNLKVDKLKGFKLGCDDYIVKPVDEEELVARINAVLKRSKTTSKEEKINLLSVGHSTFNFPLRILTINGVTYKLTAKESEVLLLLINNKNMVLNRETALKKIWGSNDYFNRRSMDVIISRLRKHLAPDNHVRITNIHSKGYCLSEIFTEEHS